MTDAECRLVDAVLELTQPATAMNWQALERMYALSREVRRERDERAGAAANKRGAALPALHLREKE